MSLIRVIYSSFECASEALGIFDFAFPALRHFENEVRTYIMWCLNFTMFALFLSYLHLGLLCLIRVTLTESPILRFDPSYLYIISLYLSSESGSRGFLRLIQAYPLT